MFFLFSNFEEQQVIQKTPNLLMKNVVQNPFQNYPQKFIFWS